MRRDTFSHLLHSWRLNYVDRVSLTYESQRVPIDYVLSALDFCFLMEKLIK